MTLLDRLTTLLGPAHVLTGQDCAPYTAEWIGKYHWQPLAVLRPADRDQVSAILRIASETGTPVVPVGGRTGLVGGTEAEGRLMLSLERMNRIREIRPQARIAVVEPGVILSRLHDAAADHGLYFPLWFGARGSAMIGGVLSTNAGGSNVLRYGSTRALCLGLEVVLADGRVLDLMSELHKDNSGYDLRDLFIGAEGTLGVITAAVMKLVPAPRAHATAMLAMPSLDAALVLLNRLQTQTGGLVEAFEFMPRSYQELANHPQVLATMEKHVRQVNEDLSKEPQMAGAQIARFLVLHKELDADDGELTRTQKVRRGFIAERYQPLIDALYSGAKESDITTEVTYEDGRKGKLSARVKISDVDRYNMPRMKEAAE